MPPVQLVTRGRGKAWGRAYGGVRTRPLTPPQTLPCVRAERRSISVHWVMQEAASLHQPCCTNQLCHIQSFKLRSGLPPQVIPGHTVHYHCRQAVHQWHTSSARSWWVQEAFRWDGGQGTATSVAVGWKGGQGVVLRSTKMSIASSFSHEFCLSACCHARQLLDNMAVQLSALLGPTPVSPPSPAPPDGGGHSIRWCRTPGPPITIYKRRSQTRGMA